MGWKVTQVKMRFDLPQPAALHPMLSPPAELRAACEALAASDSAADPWDEQKLELHIQ